MFDDLSLYRARTRSSARSACPGGTSAATTTSISRRRTARYSRETFKRVFGPNYYAFFYAETLFLMLDDVDYLGADPAKPRGGGKYEGRLDTAQLDVRPQRAGPHAAPTRWSSWCMHIPIRDLPRRRALPEPHQPGRAASRCFEGRRFTRQLLGPHPHDRASLFRRGRRLDGRGAASSSRADGAVGLVVERALDHRGVASADSRDGTPNGFHILSVDGNRYTTRFVPAKEPNGRQMRAFGSEPLPRDQQGSGPRLPPGASAGLARAARCARSFDPGRQCVRRRREDPGDDADRRAAADRDDAPRPARPVRRGGVRAQRGDQEALGQGGGLLARLDGAAARATSSPAPIRSWSRRSTNMGEPLKRAPRPRGDGIGRLRRRLGFPAAKARSTRRRRQVDAAPIPKSMPTGRKGRLIAVRERNQGHAKDWAPTSLASVLCPPARSSMPRSADRWPRARKSIVLGHASDGE